MVFAVFGMNGFIHFIPIPEPHGMAAQFMGALEASQFLVVVYAIEIVGGVILLTERYVPLALAMLCPVVVSIVLYHALMARSGFVGALVVSVLWSIVFYRERLAFAGLLARRTSE